MRQILLSNSWPGNQVLHTAATYVDICKVDLNHSALQTNQHAPQISHTDTDIAAVWKSHRTGDQLPYSVLLPRTDDAAQLGLYGENPQSAVEEFVAHLTDGSIIKEGVVVVCPPGYALMWPAQMIHCDGYLGDN